MTARVQSCPVCNQPFHGDMAAFESHVNAHFVSEDRPRPPIVAPPSLHKSSAGTQESKSTFLVQCIAEGCYESVDIEKMAEHMDRHLAELLQGQDPSSESVPQGTKRLVEEVKTGRTWPQKKSRNLSPELLHQPSQSDSSSSLAQSPKKKSGQTTMDGFISKFKEGGTARSFFSIPGSSSASPTSITSTTPMSPTSASSPHLTFLEDPLTKRKHVGVEGMIEKAKILLESSKRQGFTNRAFLADASVLFCQSDKSDRGWGCGYRNIQMMLSYVAAQQQKLWQQQPQQGSWESFGTSIPEASLRRDHGDDHGVTPEIPSIRDLQCQIEYAWSMGFDPVGARQLAHKVERTEKWIGTTEAYSVFCSMGIRSHIVDFHQPTGPNGTHPELLRVVYEYFLSPDWTPLEDSIANSSANSGRSLSSIVMQHEDEFEKTNETGGTSRSRIVQTRKPPLYMQHQGHSRTIIGIEVLDSGELNLLVFDPGRWIHKSILSLPSPASTISSSHNGTSTNQNVQHQQPGKQKKGGPKNQNQSKETSAWLDSQYLLKAFRLQLGAGYVKTQYQLLGISGLFVDDSHHSTSSVSAGPAVQLPLLSSTAALSIGWNDQEREQSKMVISTRVPSM